MVHIRIEDIENYAKTNKVPIMLKDGIDFLTEYIKENNIKSILEIGSAIGYSAIKMALVDTNIKVTTLEKDESRYNIATQNISLFKLEKQIKIALTDALDYKTNDKYDLIFIDAAKSKYIDFFNKYKNNLNKNGVIISDNLSFHGLVEDDSKTNNRNTKQLVKKIRKYIDFLKKNNEFNTKFLKIGDGLAITYLKD